MLLDLNLYLIYAKNVHKMAIRIVYLNMLFNLMLAKDDQTKSASTITRYGLL